MPLAHDSHDAVVVGASLAGCTAAILLAQQGASVLLVDKRPEPDAYKVVCGHYIQSSALPTIRRIGLYEPMLAAGAVHSPAMVHFDGGTIGPVAEDVVPSSINLRRRKLDPLLRGLAAETAGVELRLGTRLTGIDQDCGTGVKATFDGDQGPHTISARVLVGADGRDSKTAELERFGVRRWKHGRFNYSPFYYGPPHVGAPATTTWFYGDQWAGAFPTDDGLTGYYLMPTLDRLPEFKADLEGACLRTISELPGAPPVDQLELAGPIVGRVDMTNQMRPAAKDKVALAGDAALSIDPLYGVGCGWAFETGEMLADAVAPALSGEATVEQALRRYKRAVRAKLVPHALQMAGYSRGRALSRIERFAMRRAARDEGLEAQFIRLVTRNASPLEVMGPRGTIQLLRA